MRLIDADALLSQLEDWRGDKEDLDFEDGHEVAYFAAMSRAMRFTKYSPTIDAVPVVRCKDCKWYDSVFYACSKCGVCVNFDFYCADGEAKEHDQP